MSEATTTITGNAVADPQLRFTAAGQAVCNFTVCENRRKRTPAGEWVDTDPLFMAVTCWGNLAEHVAESVIRGTRVTVAGRLVPESWTDKDGNPRKSIAVTAESVGLDLQFRSYSAAGAAVAAAPLEPAF